MASCTRIRTRDHAGAGDLREDDTASLANAVIASIQGGILLARIERDGTPLRDALNQTLGTLRATAA
jgi:hypothetical protein